MISIATKIAADVFLMRAFSSSLSKILALASSVGYRACILGSARRTSQFVPVDRITIGGNFHEVLAERALQEIHISVLVRLCELLCVADELLLARAERVRLLSRVALWRSRGLRPADRNPSKRPQETKCQD